MLLPILWSCLHPASNIRKSPHPADQVCYLGILGYNLGWKISRNLRTSLKHLWLHEFLTAEEEKMKIRPGEIIPHQELSAPLYKTLL